MSDKQLKMIVESLVEAEMNTLPTVTVYFDMDGVLADFDTGVLTGNPRAGKAREVYMKMLVNFPQFQHVTDDQIRAALKGPQIDPGLKALKKAYNNFRELKFMETNKEGFFLNLPPMAGAGEMLAQAAEMTGRKPSILTAPVDNNTERCKAEKEQWMQKNFPGMYDKFICTQDKELYANADSILIDDRTKYTMKFEGNGGIAILHKNPTDSMQKLEQILKSRGLPV